jgi:DNA repair exonuclease SbcCD nuclease subunit
MIIGIFSDTHLGFDGDDRKAEAFDRFKEALNFFYDEKVDFIIHCGDLFDHSVPTQEVWFNTFNIFNEVTSKSNFFSKLVKNSFKFDLENKELLQEDIFVKGIPLIAIHGTHEFRGKDFSNALSILEKSNFLLHLHTGHVFLEKGEEKVVVHGMGGVPEKFAKLALSRYSPSPVSSFKNILLLHQSFKEFLPFDDDSIATLSLSDLPSNFNLIINGHLHWTDVIDINSSKFLLTGSTIFTQMKNLESKKDKGVFLYDTLKDEIKFVPFKIQRPLFYEKLKFENALAEDVSNLVKVKLDLIFKDRVFNLKPLVRFKLTGTLAKGSSQNQIKLDVSSYPGIFSISKDFKSIEFDRALGDIKKVQEGKKSVIEFGIDLLEKNVSDANLDFDTRRLFSLLLDNDLDKAELLLRGKV